MSFTVPQSCWNLPIQIAAGAAAGAADAQGQLVAGTSNGAVSLTLDDWYWNSTNTFALIINGWYVPTSTTPYPHHPAPFARARQIRPVPDE